MLLQLVLAVNMQPQKILACNVMLHLLSIILIKGSLIHSAYSAYKTFVYVALDKFRVDDVTLQPDVGEVMVFRNNVPQRAQPALDTILSKLCTQLSPSPVCRTVLSALMMIADMTGRAACTTQ